MAIKVQLPSGARDGNGLFQNTALLEIGIFLVKTMRPQILKGK